MEHFQICEPFLKCRCIFTPISKCNFLHILISVVGGICWINAVEAHPHYMNVEIEEGYNKYSGLIRITVRNDKKVENAGYLCDDESWNINTGEVLCKHDGHLGVNEVIHNAENQYGVHTSNLYLHGLSCEGNEESLTECQTGEWSDQKCAALAGVQCATEKQGNQSGFCGSFFARIFMSTMFVPVCTLFCVLCRCCHRHYSERRRLNMHASRFSHNASHARNSEIELDTSPTMMASADSLADLPTYEEIIKETKKEEEAEEEPPPSYETVIGTWTDQHQDSVT